EIIGNHLLVLDLHAELLLDEEDDLQHAGRVDNAATEERVVHAQGGSIRGEQIILEDVVSDLIDKRIRHFLTPGRLEARAASVVTYKVFRHFCAPCRSMDSALLTHA